jgi:hypothetical protein
MKTDKKIEHPQDTKHEPSILKGIVQFESLAI